MERQLGIILDHNFKDADDLWAIPWVLSLHMSTISRFELSSLFFPFFFSNIYLTLFLSCIFIVVNKISFFIYVERGIYSEHFNSQQVG